MFSSIYSALSGMVGFSKGLDVISNNVANMNTPGFKASELRFTDLFYQYGMGQGSGQGSEQIGEGVNTGSTRTKFQQGELRETTNGLDVAINGNGFFILQKDGQTFYTRNGQFEFDDQGFLVEHTSQAHVMAYTGGQLRPINIAGLRANSQHSTGTATFTGNLDAGTVDSQVTNVTVFDSLGGSHTLTVKLHLNNTPALVTGSPVLTTESVTSLARNTTALPSTTHTRTLINSQVPTVQQTAQPPVTTYTVQAGDDWHSIANALFGNPSAANKLQNDLSNPDISTPGTVLNNIPASIAFATIQAGEDWNAIATRLYGNVDAAGQLQTANNNMTLTAGESLISTPASFTVTASQPFYTVQSSDTWGTIAQMFYGRTANDGSSAAGNDLATQLGFNPTDPLPAEISGLHPTLNLAAPIQITGVPPYYIVQADDTSWDAVARKLYNSPVGSQLQNQLGNPPLTVGTRLPLTGTLPPTIDASNGGTFYRWEVQVLEGTTTVGQGEIRYDANGTLTGFGTMSFTYTPTSVPSSTITLDFTATKVLSGAATIQFGTQDGFASGALIDQSIDNTGRVTLKYSNGQTVMPDTVALAWFEDLQSLTLSGGNLFTPRAGQKPFIAAPGNTGLGTISSKHIELSNTDLTAQFTDIVVIQRGYQASSQVISVANEMAQQLMDLHSRK